MADQILRDAIGRLNAQTNEMATTIDEKFTLFQALLDKIATGATLEEIQADAAAIDMSTADTAALVTKLQGLGADPADPVPVEPPVV